MLVAGFEGEVTARTLGTYMVVEDRAYLPPDYKSKKKELLEANVNLQMWQQTSSLFSFWLS